MSRKLRMWLPSVVGALCLAAGIAHASVRVEVEAPRTQQLGSLWIEVVSASDSGSRSRTAVDIIDGMAVADVELPGEPPWRLRPSAPGYWGTEVELGKLPDEPVALRLLAAGSVSMILRPRTNEPSIERVEVRMTQCQSGAADAADLLGPLEVICPTSEARRVQACGAPAGCWNLRVAAAGYAPKYMWNVEIQAGEAVSLGTIELDQSAVIVGRVAVEDGTPDPQRTVVTVQPRMDLSKVSEAQKREIGQLATETTVNVWGYFQLQAAPELPLEVVVTQDGFMPAISSPLRLKAGQSLELEEPLVLRRALQLEVLLDRWEDPWGNPWTIHLLRWDPMSDPKQVAEGLIEEGAWLSPLIAQGRYVVQVVDGLDNRMAWQEVELSESHQVVPIELDMVLVRGSVVMADSPLPAQIWFGGRSGKARITARTDEEATFDVGLPRPGTWKVDVASDEAFVNAVGIEVEIDPESAEDVIIEVPSTVIDGTVVDLSGEPVSGARVLMTSIGNGGQPVAATSGVSGRFELRGLQPETYQVEASLGDLRSGVEQVMLVEDRPAAPLRLVLTRSWVLQGRVVATSGPVPRATVLAFPFTVGAALAGVTVPSTRTELNGSFELSLPGSTQLARLVVLAPGQGIALRPVQRGVGVGSEQLEVFIAPADGTLELGRVSSGQIVFYGSEPVDAMLLKEWAAMNGSGQGTGVTVAVPLMPSGVYRLCSLTVDQAILVMGGAALPEPERCSEGVLAAGGRLSLSAPGAEPGGDPADG